MALIRKSEIKKMNKEDQKSKLSELRLELIKANVTANKQNAKTREIKRAIARILTISKSAEGVSKK